MNSSIRENPRGLRYLLAYIKKKINRNKYYDIQNKKMMEEIEDNFGAVKPMCRTEFQL